MATFSVERIGPNRLSVAGEIDGATAPELVAACDDVVGDLEIECARCDFIDSAGVSALVQLRSRVAQAGGSVTLVDPSPAVRRIISITGLDEVFAVLDRPA